jgi:hypothetical protein
VSEERLKFYGRVPIVGLGSAVLVSGIRFLGFASVFSFRGGCG